MNGRSRNGLPFIHRHTFYPTWFATPPSFARSCEPHATRRYPTDYPKSLITQACTDFDVCIKLTVFEQFRPPDYENDFGFALSRLVFSQIVFS
jgi:hypothetical protein